MAVYSAPILKIDSHMAEPPKHSGPFVRPSFIECLSFSLPTGWNLLWQNSCEDWWYHLSARIQICGDTSIFITRSGYFTQLELWHSHVFSVAYDLSQIVAKPTRIPDTTGHHANLLDSLYHIFSWKKYSTEVLPPLDTSDHSLIDVKVNAKPKMWHFTERLSTQQSWLG